MSLVEIGTPPTPNRRLVCLLPLVFGRRGTLAGKKMGQESPNSDEGNTLWYSLYVGTLQLLHVEFFYKINFLLFFSSVKRRERKQMTTVALVSHRRPKLRKFPFYKRVLVLKNVMFFIALSYFIKIHNYEYILQL